MGDNGNETMPLLDPAPRGLAASQDEALADNLTKLLAMAKEIGAVDTWVVRGAIAPLLCFALPTREPVLSEVEGAPVAVDMADGGTIVVLRFAAVDGGEVGVERR